MGLVKTRRLAAMQKQQRAKAGMKVVKPCKLQAKPRERVRENRAELSRKDTQVLRISLTAAHDRAHEY